MSLYEQYQSKGGSFAATAPKAPEPEKKENLFQKLARSAGELIGIKKSEPTPGPQVQTQAPQGSLFDQYQGKAGIFSKPEKPAPLYDQFQSGAGIFQKEQSIKENIPVEEKPPFGKEIVKGLVKIASPLFGLNIPLPASVKRAITGEKVPTVEERATQRAEVLKKEGMTREMIERPEDFVSPDYEEPQTFTGQLFEGIKSGYYGTILPSFGSMIESLGYNLTGKSGETIRNFGANLADTALAKYLKQPELLAPKDLKPLTEGGIKDPRAWGRTIGETAPFVVTMLGSGALAALTKNPALVKLATFGSVAGVETGSAYKTMIDRGIAPDKAATASQIYGAISSGIENAFGFKPADIILGSGKQAVSKSFKDFIMKELPKQSVEFLSKVLQEGGEESAQQLIQNLITKWLDKSQPVLENVAESFLQGLVGSVPFGASEIIRNIPGKIKEVIESEKPAVALTAEAEPVPPAGPAKAATETTVPTFNPGERVAVFDRGGKQRAVGEVLVVEDGSMIVKEDSSGLPIRYGSAFEFRPETETKVVKTEEEKPVDLEELHRANPELFNKATKAKTLDEFLSKMGTPDQVDYGVLTDFYNKAKSVKIETKAVKTEKIQTEEKTFYRGGGQGEVMKGKTAQDILNYEQKDLGNADVVAEPGIDLSKIPGERVQWLTETEAAAKEYGEVEPVKVSNYRIIARDNQGGVLIETMPATQKEKVKVVVPTTVAEFNKLSFEDQDKIFSKLEPSLQAKVMGVGAENELRKDVIAAVKKEGGIAPQRTKTPSGKTFLAEEYQDIPLFARRKGGKPIDEMVDTLNRRGFNIETEEDLLDILRSPKEYGAGRSLAFRPKNLENPSSPVAQAEVDKIVKRSDIVKELESKLNLPIKHGKFRVPGAAGIYKKGPKVVRVKSGYLQTIFHEVGHYLDDTVPEIRRIVSKIGQEEKEALLQEYANPPQGRRRKGEAFSEFLRFYLTEKQKAFDLAPNFYKEYEKVIRDLPEIKEILDKASFDYKRWLDMPAIAKVMSQISLEAEGKKGGLLSWASGTWHRIYEMVLDDLHPLDMLSQKARKLGVEIPIKENPYILARNLRGWIGKADTFLTKGTFGRKFWKQEDGKTVPDFNGKGLQEILKPLEDKGILEDFRVYLVSRRTVELAKRGIKSGISRYDAESVIKQLEGKYPELKDSAQDLYSYQNRLLDFGRESGLYDEKFLARIGALNKEYVPFYRVFEEVQSKNYLGRGLGNVSKKIKKIKGSERDIIDPLESIVKNTYTIINAAERNNVAMALVNVSKLNHELERMVEHIPTPMGKVATVNAGEIIKEALGPSGELLAQEMGEAFELFSQKTVNIFRPSFFTKDNVITVLINGKASYYEVDPDLYRSIQGLDAEDIALVWKVLSYPAKFLRAGATLVPEFIARNPVRDQFTSYIYSNFGFRPAIDLARGAWSLIKQDSDYWLWRMGGGEHSMMVSMDRESLRKSLEEITASKGEKTLNIVKNPLKMLQIVSELGEAGTRLGEMKKAIARGADPIEAAFSAREVTLDFARIGSKTRALNSLIGFFNATMQGTDKMIRAFKDRPYQTLFKTLAGITLPSVLLYFANRKDPRWKEIPQWQKNLFWIILTEKHIYRIPKPFELGIIFGSVPERILEYADLKDPEVFNDIDNQIVEGVLPSFLPTVLLPWIENATNYSFFLQRRLVSESREDLPPEAQFNEYTSEFSKEVGKWLNYSPIKIDNIIKGYFAGLGTYATQAIDKVLEGTGVVNPLPKPAKTLEQMPIFKAFMIREPIGASSESVSRLYDKADQSAANYAYYNELTGKGLKDEAAEYLANHPDLKMSQYYSSIRDQISTIRKLKDGIMESKSLSPEEKKGKIDRLDRLMTQIAAKALEIRKK